MMQNCQLPTAKLGTILFCFTTASYYVCILMIFNIMTIFNIKLISSGSGSVEKPAIAQIFNLGKIRAIGRVPRGTSCYIKHGKRRDFYHSVVGHRKKSPLLNTGA